VREEAWPLVRDRDELHDALHAGWIHHAIPEGRRGDGETGWRDVLRRACVKRPGDTRLRPAAQSIGAVGCHRTVRSQVRAAIPGSTMSPEVHMPADLLDPDAPDDALREVVRSRLEMLGGPCAFIGMASSMAPCARARSSQTLRALEVEGFVVQGKIHRRVR
jgi:hypothetical protein